ncbi:unnamed protein product [Zymoseptoria tritici ST99CH_1E4]|uniref:JmjC domain-containing protein n=1 Tax=Zymoseptoria tritici ST99CH_1E4 TaxID=1276532 RepID=A0A2H1GZJ8_ZYMTR|nr:unnamed protein product [Zymoseptoria tritici ST99CH_1E4]
MVLTRSQTAALIATNAANAAANVLPNNAVPAVAVNVAAANAAPVIAAPVIAAPVIAVPVNAVPIPANAASVNAASVNAASVNAASVNAAPANAATANAATGNGPPASLTSAVGQKRPSDSADSDRSPKRTRHDLPEGSDDERPPIPPLKLYPRRAKRREAATAADKAYLADSISQFAELKAAQRGSWRAFQISSLLKILPKISPPSDKLIQTSIGEPGEGQEEEIGAYYLAADEAKALLSSNQPVTAPVFVPGGARRFFVEPADSRRPIEQALSDWFIDPREPFAFRNVAAKKSTGHEEEGVTMDKLRPHFLAPEDKMPVYPWNLPDIVNPLGASAVPEFLQSNQCQFLNDLMRMMVNPDLGGICPPGCSASDQSCDKHTVTLSELNDLRFFYAHWQGTLMISDPGAVTLSHFDRWSLGTWISCYEGEIGICWLNHPSEKEQMACINTESRIPKNTLFKVLRSGDAVYMPPGTVHIVWRLPQGGQTMGMAGHILRRGHLDGWLEMLRKELANLIKRGGAPGYDTVVRPLMRGVKQLVESLKDKRDVERLGGADKLASALKTIAVLEEQVIALAALQPDGNAQDEKDDDEDSVTNAGAAPEQSTDDTGATETVSGAEGTQAQAGSEPAAGEANL